jgi:hypothetical protein
MSVSRRGFLSTIATIPAVVAGDGVLLESKDDELAEQFERGKSYLFVGGPWNGEVHEPTHCAVAVPYVDWENSCWLERLRDGFFTGTVEYRSARYQLENGVFKFMKG